MGANEGLWGPHGAPWGAVGGCGGCVGHTAPRVTRFCADFCYIMSIFAFSADFHDFLATKLSTPILAERVGCANPCLSSCHVTARVCVRPPALRVCDAVYWCLCL